MQIPFLEANGARIPAIGLGTWELRGRTCTRMVGAALRLGYRHIDTAEMYDNEREVGEGLRASGIDRRELFVTTKVWPSHFAPRELERAAKASLARLQLAQVDLLLLHWPNPQIPLSETLDALCKIKRMGLARHIGVSNFTVALVEQAVKLMTEPLVCNQIEMHPLIDQSKVAAACRRHGMAVVAYSPIAMCTTIKPYSFDLLMSLLLLVPAVQWLHKPEQLRWLIWLRSWRDRLETVALDHLRSEIGKKQSAPKGPNLIHMNELQRLA